MHRFILTGAPGAGKTTLLRELAARGHRTVPEAATDVIARAQAVSEAEPWTDPDFPLRVLALQRERQRERQWERQNARQGATAAGAVLLHDRSPVCTHALAVYLGRPVPPALAAELERIVDERVYRREVFLVRPIGFCTPSAARRIDYPASLAFERVHQDSYRHYGFRLLDVPPGPVPARADLVADTLARLAPG